MLIPKAEGHFTNDDNFYGLNRKEYLHVTFKNGKWQGLKVVGDTNVPRGKVSFRTVGHLSDIQNTTQAEIQIRSQTWNADGFSWMKSSVRFNTFTDKWFINLYGRSFSFSRVNENEALNAAQNNDQE